MNCLKEFTTIWFTLKDAPDKVIEGTVLYYMDSYDGKADEKGYDAKTGRLLVDVNPEFYRPAEVEFLWGDCTKAEKELGWKRDVSFEGLVKMMMDADMKEITGMNCEEYKAANN